MKPYKRLFKESLNYNKILTPQVKKILHDSILAAEYEGNIDEVYIDTDQIITSFLDKVNLSPQDYANFDYEKAEDFLLDTLERMKKSIKK